MRWRLKAEHRLWVDLLVTAVGALAVYLVASALIGCTGFELSGLKVTDDKGQTVEVDGLTFENAGPTPTHDEDGG